VVTLRGGCQCRLHRYTVQLDKPEGYFCHCRMCQQAFGNIFAAFINVSVDNVSWDTSEPAYYKSSRIARRGFCAACWHATGVPVSRCNVHGSPGRQPRRAGRDPPTNTRASRPRRQRPRPLPESRVDDNERIRARWQAAYGRMWFRSAAAERSI
jgi:hypothetical protein